MTRPLPHPWIPFRVAGASAIDGSGAAAQILFAALDTAPATLAASDFQVI